MALEISKKKNFQTVIAEKWGQCGNNVKLIQFAVKLYQYAVGVFQFAVGLDQYVVELNQFAVESYQ